MAFPFLTPRRFKDDAGVIFCGPDEGRGSLTWIKTASPDLIGIKVLIARAR